MLKADAAEWILSLTTTPEHAASTVGDLVEQAGARGTLWFWASVARTTAALAWRTFAQAPGNVVWLAFYGMVFQAFYMALLVTIGTFFLLVVGTALGVLAEWKLAIELEMLVSVVVVAILYGKWLVRKAPQRELTVFIVFWLLYLVPTGASLLIWPSLSVVFDPDPDTRLSGATTLLGIVFTFAGIQRARGLTSAQ